MVYDDPRGPTDAGQGAPVSALAKAPAPANAPVASGQPRIVAVVVAYNRRDLLIECLSALEHQDRPVDAVLVVDNASTDDSAGVARTHPVSPVVLTLPTNTGGAGGFAAGISYALTDLAADAVWLMDDDTIPTPSALTELLDACEAYPGRVDVAGSRVVWTDGRDHPMNTPRIRPGASRAAKQAAASVDALPIRSTSFVSMLISAKAIEEHGLPVADYFIWNDDFEYSSRLLRRGVGLHVRRSVVVHKTKTFGATDADPGERFFYEVRNKVWMLTRSSSLSPVEKVLYGGSTIRRWIKTIVKSRDRKTLQHAAFRGIAASRERPRSTASILKSLDMTPPTRAGYSSGRGLGHVPPRPPVTTAPQPFSLLLPVYHGDSPEFLRRAYDSATAEQTRPPDEVVIVRDGPVGQALEAELSDIEARSVVPVTVVREADNRGLATALTVGLQVCQHDIVARADADDISLPDRFAVQIPVIEQGADLVGAAIVEFGGDENVTAAVRHMPTGACEIARKARFADPFNHPSVVFRRQAVQQAGGYQHLHLMEDYLLFARMIHHGAVVANVPETLVKYRVGAGSYARRGGRALLKSEIELQRTLRREGFTTGAQLMRNVAVRGGYRLVPEWLRRTAYRAVILGRHGDRHSSAGPAAESRDVAAQNRGTADGEHDAAMKGDN